MFKFRKASCLLGSARLPIVSCTWRMMLSFRHRKAVRRRLQASLSRQSFKGTIEGHLEPLEPPKPFSDGFIAGISTTVLEKSNHLKAASDLLLGPALRCLQRRLQSFKERFQVWEGCGLVDQPVISRRLGVMPRTQLAKGLHHQALAERQRICARRVLNRKEVPQIAAHPFFRRLPPLLTLQTLFQAATSLL